MTNPGFGIANLFTNDTSAWVRNRPDDNVKLPERNHGVQTKSKNKIKVNFSKMRTAVPFDDIPPQVDKVLAVSKYSSG